MFVDTAMLRSDPTDSHRAGEYALTGGNHWRGHRWRAECSAISLPPRRFTPRSALRTLTTWKR